MRRIIFILFAMLCLFSYARQEQIVLTQNGHQHDREGLPLFFDTPIAYYHYETKTQEIIINGNGAVSYYDVEIASAATNIVEISTQVNGTYDTFDISSLATGTYIITIESPSGNFFQGTFTTY